MDLPGADEPGPSRLTSVADAGAGAANLAWTNAHADPAQYLGFGWDVYAGAWALPTGGVGMWAPYPPHPTTGTLELRNSGAYHLWISSQFFGGEWFACVNPWTGIVYSGTPHTPLDAQAVDLGGQIVRLSWRPDFYGTWHNQIIAWSVDANDWVALDGPWHLSMWQFVFYPNADFLSGTVDLTVPAPGAYWFLVRGASWLPPYNPPATGEFASAYVEVAP